MSETSERYRKVAEQFTQRVEAVPPDAWGNPSPCEGWVARDVVRHLVEWIPGFFDSYAGVVLPAGPSVDDDPVAAWHALDAALVEALADPTAADREFDSPLGPTTLERAVDMICTSDVLVHTWDLARATGLDETLDPAEVRGMLAGIEPMVDTLSQSGHYAPPVPVPDGTDDQTRLLALLGRRP